MITLALVLTPVASARALAALCGLDGLDVEVIPTSRGAVVVRAVGGTAPRTGGAAKGESRSEDDAERDPAEDAEWDIAELLDDDIPAEARELAARISRLSGVGVVLLAARLTEDTGLDTGLSGQIMAQRYAAGEPGEDLPAGLVLAEADEVVEDLLLGRRSVTDVPGNVRSRNLEGGRRRFGKGLRRPRP